MPFSALDVDKWADFQKSAANNFRQSSLPTKPEQTQRERSKSSM